MLKTLLIVDESPIYGGHEAMFMAFLKAMLFDLRRHYLVYFLVNDANKKLLDQLSCADYLGVEVLPVKLTRLPIKPISGFFLPIDFFRLKRLVAQLRPCRVLNIQGTIEIGSTSLRVCQSLGVEVFSYLPITKSSAAMGAFLGRARDFVCKRFYYKMPKKIITISKANLDELASIFGVQTSRIALVNNFVEQVVERQKVTVPPLANNKKHLAIIGRISNAQKRQFDFLSRWLRLPESLAYTVHVIGDANDKESRELHQLCKEARSDGRVYFHGWQPSAYVTEMIKRCDAVVLPSRFEGVPLVMIEAIQLGKPVIATRVDGMKAFLPDEWTFELNDWAECFRILVEPLNQQKLNLSCFEKTVCVTRFTRLLVG